MSGRYRLNRTTIGRWQKSNGISGMSQPLARHELIGSMCSL
jgi:hypothetical protein